jgi:hypothetical protein
VQEQRVRAPPLSDSFTFQFHIDQPSIPFPSYHGLKYSLCYFIVVCLQISLFSKTSESKEIVFLQPCPQPAQPAETAGISICQPPIHFTFRTEKTVYATDEIINGQLVFGRSSQNDLQGVTIYLYLTELFREGSSLVRSDETALLCYELVDGAPRPNAAIPFLIQLAPLQLWAAKSANSAIITTMFRLEVHLTRGGVAACAGRQIIQIYHRIIAEKRG